ncbi:MAG: DUF4177 domain-containing protein [Pseudomonadota bacterium]
MSKTEYKAVPCPDRSTGEPSAAGDPLANILTDALNKMAEDGWEYLRVDTVPLPARGLFRLLGRSGGRQAYLVFRREAPAFGPRADFPAKPPNVTGNPEKSGGLVTFVRSDDQERPAIERTLTPAE